MASRCKRDGCTYVGSSPTWPTIFIWGRGAIGSAIPLQGKGCGFKSHRFHHRGPLDSGGRPLKQLLLSIWVGSESANAADCKSVLFKVVGSTPTLPTIFRDIAQFWQSASLGWKRPLVQVQLFRPDASAMTSIPNNQRGVLRSGCKRNE